MGAVEYEQPALVAEALAQAAVHRNDFAAFFARADAVRERSKPEPRSLLDLCETVGQEQPELVAAAYPTGQVNIFDALVNGVPELAGEFLASIKVQPENLEEQIDEMIHVNAFLSMASVFHPPHEPRYDFFIM